MHQSSKIGKIMHHKDLHVWLDKEKASSSQGSCKKIPRYTFLSTKYFTAAALSLMCAFLQLNCILKLTRVRLHSRKLACFLDKEQLSNTLPLPTRIAKRNNLVLSKQKMVKSCNCAIYHTMDIEEASWMCNGLEICKIRQIWGFYTDKLYPWQITTHGLPNDANYKLKAWWPRMKIICAGRPATVGCPTSPWLGARLASCFVQAPSELFPHFSNHLLSSAFPHKHFEHPNTNKLVPIRNRMGM